MIYFDTNIYLYAFSKNIDDINQQEKSIEVLEKALKEKKVITSEIILYEYAFVSKKLEEENADIEDYNCEKFITFDKGFKRFQDLRKVEIVIL